MLIVPDVRRSTDLPRGCVATVGNFDGLHRGQRAIVDRVVERARELGVPSALLTFEPHPLEVLAPERAPLRIVTPRQRERLLEEAGLDVLLTLSFDADLAALSAEEFVRQILVEALHVREVYVGSQFGFGRGRSGNLDLLRKMGSELGFEAFGVAERLADGEPVSSSRIRRAIQEGQVERAAELLGRPFSLTGTVVRGDRMGKKLGWPTINVRPEGELEPLEGVYATRVYFPSFPARFDSVTNIGTRPTVLRELPAGDREPCLRLRLRRLWRAGGALLLQAAARRDALSLGDGALRADPPRRRGDARILLHAAAF